MMKISEELVERMIALVRHAAIAASGHTEAEAQAILALLPDPDLLEARKIAEDLAPTMWPSYVGKFANGDNDDADGMKGLVKAIKRGRELERNQ